MSLKETNPEFIHDFAFPLPVMVIADMLGVPQEDRNIFKRWSNSLARLLDVTFLSEEQLDEGDLAAAEIRDYFRQQVRARARNPKEDIIESYTLLHDQQELIPSAVEEILRYESPVQVTNRTAGEDILLGDTLIRRGQEVFLSLGAANRDPAVFNDPDYFDITRKKNRHLSFATGPHFCIGAPLARLEAITAFQVLLKQYPALRFSGPTPIWRN